MTNESQEISTQVEIPDNSLIDFKIRDNHIFFSACHRLPSRSFYFRGKPLMCYRCLGLNGSFFLIITLQVLFAIPWLLGLIPLMNIGNLILLPFGHNLVLQFLFAILLQVPFVLDGSIQAVIKRYESNNPLRFITGVLGGTGQYLLMFVFGKFLGFLLFKS